MIPQNPPRSINYHIEYEYTLLELWSEIISYNCSLVKGWGKILDKRQGAQ